MQLPFENTDLNCLSPLIGEVFFNSEYYSTVLHGPWLGESMDTEELWTQRVKYKTYVATS